MTSWMTRAAVGLAIASAPFLASAASVTLNSWTFGSGNNVNLNFGNGQTYSGGAGGFSGSLTGTTNGQYDSNSFATYCIELTEAFAFGTTMTQYNVVAGNTYFTNRYNDATKATTLGKLLTYVYNNPTSVDTAVESTAMQLAVWNVIYDTDYSVSTGSFTDRSTYATLANSLLAGAASITTSQYSVFALEKAGTQDFLLGVRNPSASGASVSRVPEPSSWALGLTALLALVGTGVMRRKTDSSRANPLAQR